MLSEIVHATPTRVPRCCNSDTHVCSTVLVVDSDPDKLEAIDRGLFLSGNRCVVRATVSEAINLLNRPNGPKVDLLLTGITDPRSHSFKLIEHIHDLHSDLPIIAVSTGGPRSADEIESARRVGIMVL